MSTRVPQQIPMDVIKGVAMTSALFLFSLHLPLLGFLGTVFIPLPVLFYRMKLGRSRGIVIPAISLALAVMGIRAAGIDLLFFAELLLLGFVLAELYEQRLSVERTVAYACGFVLATGFGGLLLFSGFAGKGLLQLLTAYVAKNLELSLQLYKTMEVSKETIDLIASSMDRLTQMLVRIIPALTTATTLMITWTNLLLSRPVLRNHGQFVPDFGDLTRWRSPDPLVWGVIGSGLMLMVPIVAVKVTGLNVLLVLLTVYFFQGIAICAFFFERKKVPRMIRVFGYTLIALQQFLLLLVIGIGFFDVWLDLRKIRSSDENSTPPDLPPSQDS